MSQSTILSVENLTKTYQSGDKKITVLKDVSLELGAGNSCAVVGPSGSGKTTFLGLCAGLDQVSSGSVSLVGKTLDSLDEEGRAQIRRKHVGFVFQTFRLIPTLTALENVMVPLEIQGMSHEHQKAQDILDRVGLESRFHHYPAQLSGGEQQRVALARAYVHAPKILFADEPTGNLDEETSHIVENLLFDLIKTHGTTLLLVTHNMELARRTQRILRLKGGCVIEND